MVNCTNEYKYIWYSFQRSLEADSQYIYVLHICYDSKRATNMKENKFAITSKLHTFCTITLLKIIFTVNFFPMVSLFNISYHLYFSFKQAYNNIIKLNESPSYFLQRFFQSLDLFSIYTSYVKYHKSITIKK